MRGSIALRTKIATHPRMIAVVAVVAAGTLVAAILIMLMTASARAVVPEGSTPLARNDAPLVTDPDATPEGEFAPGEVIVKFKETVGPGERANVRSQVGLEKRQDLDLIKAEVDKVKGRSVEDAVRASERRPEVEYAQPNFTYSPAGYADEPRFGELWGLNNTGQNGGTPSVDMNALEASAVTQGDPNLVVAVIDTGVDFSHPDLSGRKWVNPGESGGGKETNNIDDDGNGFVDDVNGADFFNNDGNPFDDNSHGTHVSGTIAASVNGQGVVGVAPNVKIMALKFLNASNNGFTSDAIEAIGYAKSKGAKISNNSWGGGPYDQALYDAINNSGSLFVAAAGNGGADQISDNNDDSPFYPASYNLSNILSVAAIDNQGKLASFSNYGATSVDIAAPGVGILSTLPGNTHGSFDGTSMAAPHATGAAALVASVEPTLLANPVGLKSDIMDAGKSLPATAGKTVTGDMVDALKAVDPNADTTAPNTSIDSGPSGPTNDNTPTFTFSATDDVTPAASLAFSYSVDGKPWSAFSSATSVTLPALAECNHTFYVRAKDQVGNVDLSAAERSFRIDAVPDNFCIDTSVGTAAPPGTLGGYTMTPFALDSRILGQSVTDVPAPGGRTLQLDRSMGHYRIGSGWGSWSHGYSGDVYSNWFAASPTRDQVMMTLPSNTKAFYFYVEPNASATYNVTATGNDGTTSGPIAVRGSSGAKYFGFYSEGGTTLSTITVNVDAGAQGFAIGEYGIDNGDTTAPTAKAPTHKFTTLSTLGTTTVPVKLTWSATDNPGGSGIASYQLQQSINGGASYTNVTLPSATATTISPSLAPGTNTYRYRVAAKDKAGNLSAWATGPSFKVSTYQESNSAIVDTGSWTTSALSGAYGGSVQYASALGRNATFTVPVGTKNVEWVSNRGPNRGKAQVWLDGVQQDANPSVTGIQPFDLYSSTAQARKVVFSKAVSATTTHNLQVRVLGQKNASSTSTRVDIDAFVRTS
jgi:subtilisin family serine protease